MNPNDGFELLDNGFELLNDGFELLDDGFELLEYGFELPNDGFELLNCKFQNLVIAWEKSNSERQSWNNIFSKNLPSFLASEMPIVNAVVLTVIVVTLLVETTASCREGRKVWQGLDFITAEQQVDVTVDAIPGILNVLIPPLQTCEGDGGRTACLTEVMAVRGRQKEAKGRVISVLGFLMLRRMRSPWLQSKAI